MFPLNFHYEDVSRQDPLLKPNHVNVMEVPRSCEIRVVQNTSYFIIKNGKLAMEIPHGHKFIQNFKNKGYVSYRRGHRMYNFSVRVLTVMSLLELDSPVEIRENSIKIYMDCEFSPELEEIFYIFEHIFGFNVTIVTSANTQDDTLPPWSGFLQKDERKVSD